MSTDRIKVRQCRWLPGCWVVRLAPHSAVHFKGFDAAWSAVNKMLRDRRRGH